MALDLVSAIISLISQASNLMPIVENIINTKSTTEKKLKQNGLNVKVRLASVQDAEGYHLAILIDLPNDNFEKAVVALLKAFGEDVKRLNCAKGV